MSCEKCRKSTGLCPLSLGVALGITSGLAVFVWSFWVMQFGMPATMSGYMAPPHAWKEIWMLAGWCALKGFVFGLVLALIYDMISRCCKASCCKKATNGKCGCE